MPFTWCVAEAKQTPQSDTSRWSSYSYNQPCDLLWYKSQLQPPHFVWGQIRETLPSFRPMTVVLLYLVYVGP